jgi:sulfoxide reductase heme-binding subunit YedZ
MTWNRCVAGLWLLSVTGVVVSAAGDNDAYSYSVSLVRGFGYLAFSSLSGALCVSPLRRWLRESAKLRRALGLAAASAALLHVLAATSSSPLTLREQVADTHLRFGVGAFAVLCLLALSSFPRAVSRLQLRSWKELHRLAYVAWICGLLHGLVSPYAWLWCLLSLAASVVLIGLLRVWPLSNNRKLNAESDRRTDCF